jgi:lysophospholipase L1-like esterase
MALPVIAVPNGIAVRQATAAAGGLPVTVSTNGRGLGVTPVVVGGMPVTDTSGTLFGPATIPGNTGLPVITGTTMVGQTLLTSLGTWSGSAASYGFQWKRGGVAISGATSNAYTLVTADLGATITVTVTATNSAGSASATAAGVGPVLAAPVAPANTVLPAITGSANVGSILSASSGTWTGTATITYAYQWQRSGGNISGATANSYTLVTADIGASITVVVTATNIAGSASATSAAIGPVTDVPVAPVFATTRNFVSEGDSLTSSGANWALKGAFASLPGFQIKANVAVAGATLNDIVARAAATDARIVPGALNVLSLLIGANSLGDTTAYPTVNNYLTALAAYCDARRTAGWYVLLVTMLPLGAGSGVNTHNTRRAVANPELKLWTTTGSIVSGKHADQIFDLAADPVMGPDNSHQASPTYWSGDFVHPSQLGYDRMAALGVVSVAGSSSVSISKAPPASVTRLMHLTPRREVGGGYSSPLAVAPNCAWTLQGGSDAGFAITTGPVVGSNTTPNIVLTHAAGSVGSFVANLRGVDAFGNVYAPTLTLTVSAVDGTLNVAPNGGRFDSYYLTQLANPLSDGTTAYGIEELNGNPTFYLTAVTGAGFSQANIGKGGPTTVAGTYEWSFRTWKDRPGTTVNMAIQGADAIFASPFGTPTSTTPVLRQGTYAQSVHAAFDMLYYFDQASGVVVGEKAYLDDVELRPVLGVVITKGVFAPSGPTTARVSVTTPGATGTMYAVITPRANRPTKAQIKAGVDEIGGAPLGVGSTAVTSAKAYTVDVSGLTPATEYHAHFVHETAAGYSNTMWAGGVTRGTAITTFSPVNKGPSMALSNGNKTVTRSASSGFWQTIVSIDGVASGTHSFMVTFGGTLLGQWAIGVINTGNSAFFDFGDSGGIIGGDPSFSFGYVFNNTILPGGVASGITAPVLGDTIEFVIDANLRRLRVRNVTAAPGTYSAWLDVSTQPFWDFPNSGAAGGASIYAIVGLKDVSQPIITADFTGWGA